MASNNVACIGQRSACAVRATRLGPDCSPVTGAANMTVVAESLVTMTATPDVEEGTKYEPKDACGRLVFTAADPDVIKRWTLDIELVLWDPELIEIMTDSTLLVGSGSSPWSGKSVGVLTPGPQTAQGNGVALEIWAKTATGSGVCGPAATTPPWTRHVFPRTLLRLNDRTFENDVANLKFSGTAEANVSWNVGPYGDWIPTVGMGGSPYAWFYDDDVPAGTCGYATGP